MVKDLAGIVAALAHIAAMVWIGSLAQELWHAIGVEKKKKCIANGWSNSPEKLLNCMCGHRFCASV